jgi:gamma-glutamylaminecyclotransferase
LTNIHPARETEMPHTLFVYGTLKRNFSNYHLLKDSQCLGPGCTKEEYAMYENGIPFVFKNEPVSRIHGELYQIDDITLQRLDKLEGHPDWYCREQVEIITASKQTITAWIYFYPEKTGKLNKRGVFKE